MSLLGRKIVTSFQKRSLLTKTVNNLLRTMSSTSTYNFETLKVTSPKEYVFQVEMNRPEKRNAMNKAFWREMVTCFNQIAKDPECRAVVICGAGKMFTGGLDISDNADVLMGGGDEDIARKAFKARDVIKAYQESFTVMEKCPKPVLAAIHNGCIGGGVDLITACDMRYCTKDAWFQIKEIDLGLAADVGTLQRLPKVVGNDSLVRELAYTGRKLLADEAFRFGLVSAVFEDHEALMKAAIDTASKIAEMSPVAMQGIKINLVYSRDHSVPDSLDYVANWNQAMIQTEDLVKAVTAGMQKEKATFSKL